MAFLFRFTGIAFERLLIKRVNMKKLIYISIIAVVLSACKGNSFMTQRYTHFGHNTHKQSGTEKIAAKSGKIITVDRPETVCIKEDEAANLQASSNASLLKEDLIRPLSLALQFQKSENSISKKETEGVDQSKTISHSKKLVKEKNQVAKRIIGTLLKIILWIIILAVIVGIILIIAALA